MAPTLGSFVFVTAAIVAAVNAHPQTFPGDYHRLAPRTEGFKWEPCPEGAGRECSRFEVPLDWHDSSIGKASLAVARFPAVKEPKLGTLFVNPGGPGQSGRAMVIGPLGEVIRNASGGQYDILGWDPRGVGMSVPLARCAETIEDLQSIRLPAQPRGGIEARGNFTSKDDIDAFYAQIDEVDAGIKEFGKRCLEFSPHTFPYMGTAAVVRDMVAMHDVLEGKDKPIDYWGFSYGTIIGIYFANMFPDRVGRVILDGVVDSVYWANRLPHTGGSRSLESADEAFAGFALACAAAGPKGCAIAFENSTADSIIGWTRNLLDAAYDYRREMGPDANITSDSIRGAIFDAMYQPLTWPMLAKDLKSLADQLASFFSGSNTTSQKRSTATPLFDLKRRQGNTTADDQLLISDLANTGVRCSDAVDPSGVTTKDVFEFIVNNTRDVSPMFGPRWFDAGYYCHHWPVRAVERYTGPWNKKLSNPIIIIGNEADPITPYISAKSVADALGDSAILIEQDDYGHVSLAMHSDCTFAAVEDYFVNNKLPAQDKFCGTNQELFPGPGITKKVLAQLTASKGSGGTSLEADLQATKDRSQKLFIAVIALAAATGILLVSLMVSCMRGRRKGSINAAHIPRGVFEKAAAEEGQGHLYDDPYMPAGGSKAGGYSRVEA